MNKVIKLLLVMFFSNQISAIPWYEFADHSKVDVAVKVFDNLNPNNRVALARSLYHYAGQLKLNIDILQLVSPKGERTDYIEDLKDQFVALIIRAKDLGNVDAKRELMEIVFKGEFGVDQDIYLAKEIRREIDDDNPYVELMPLYEYDEISLQNQPQIEICKNRFKSKRRQQRCMYDFAESRLSHIDEESNREAALRNYVSLLLEANKLGSLDAKKCLSSILYEGSFGVQRDKSLATYLRLSVDIETQIVRLEKYEAKIIKYHAARMQYFDYNPGAGTLQLWYDGRAHNFAGNQAMKLGGILVLLKDREELVKASMQILLTSFPQAYLKDYGIDLDTVD